MPEEWPIAAVPAERTAVVRGGGGRRLATVRIDFFLDSAHRLSEQERALMTAMLQCLVGEVADAVRAALPAGWAPANDESNAELVESLARHRLLDQAELVGLLLQRADEERIGAAGRARSGRRDARTIQGLVSNHDAAVSAAAMALILARGRRRDRFGQCMILFDDLKPGLAAGLVELVCAAIRPRLEPVQGAGPTDSALGLAAEQVLADHDPARSVERATAALVAALAADQPLEPLILAAANEGELGFIAHAIAARAGISSDAAIDELLSGDARRLMLLLRAAGLPRDSVAGLLAALGDLLGLEDPARAIALFDRATDREVAETRAWLSASPDYRSAVLALGGRHG